MGRLYQKSQKLQQRPAFPQQEAHSDQEFQFSCPTARTQVRLSHSCL